MDIKKEPFPQRLLGVIKGASYVQKKGKNKEQGYNYAMEADFLELVKPLLLEAGIIPIPVFELISSEQVQTQAGKPACLATLKLTLTLRDVHSPEQVVIQSIGQGRDPQDKAAYKAMTGAMKYAISKAFMIPTGDDPEDSEEEEKPVEKKEGKKEANPEKAFLDAVQAVRYKLLPEDFIEVMADFKAINWPEDLLLLPLATQRAFYKALVERTKPT